jgi:hypothetical protein
MMKAGRYERDRTHPGQDGGALLADYMQGNLVVAAEFFQLGFLNFKNSIISELVGQ